jgi:hypothetical protein
VVLSCVKWRSSAVCSELALSLSKHLLVLPDLVGMGT